MNHTPHAPTAVNDHTHTVPWVEFDADLARDGSVDPVDKAVYAAIASFEGTALQPTRKALAACIGRSVDTVDRAIKRLTARGLVEKEDTAVATYAPLPGERPVAGGRRRSSSGISARRRARVYARDGYRCLACGATDDLTLDHIQHQSHGGRHQEDNLRTLCRSCNSRRGARSLPGLDDVEVAR